MRSCRSRPSMHGQRNFGRSLRSRMLGAAGSGVSLSPTDITSGRSSTPQARGNSPTRFDMADGKEMAHAGLWSSWRSPMSGEEILTCTVFTCAPNASLAEIHDRMPVILAVWSRSVGESGKLIQHSGRDYGPGTSWQRHDHARGPSCNTAIEGSAQRLSHTLQPQPEDCRQMAQADVCS